MSYPKFIINQGNLIIGRVSFHKFLANDHSTTKGGGWYHLDAETKKLYLYGESIDFGPCTREDLKQAVNNGMLASELKDVKIYFVETNQLRTALERASAENRIK